VEAVGGGAEIEDGTKIFLESNRILRKLEDTGRK